MNKALFVVVIKLIKKIYKHLNKQKNNTNNINHFHCTCVLKQAKIQNPTTMASKQTTIITSVALAPES